MTDLADLGWVNVDVNDLGTLGKALGISGYSVIESRTKGNKKV